ncbi:MAG: toll/interleukin-1 receptor domain-containing protein [Burkholderiales bacterium]
MSDIFISYASEDRERARQIAATFTGLGWSVWWDRQIPFGKTFDQVIEQNLAQAKCVVVLWTKHSVDSRWVRAEASDGVGREMLLPVVLERDLKLPLQFKMLQAANLADWHPDVPHEEFQRLLKSIESLLGSPSAHKAEAIKATTTQHDSKVVDGNGLDVVLGRSKKSNKAFYGIGLLVLPSVVIAAVALVLMNWRVPTRVQIDLIVDRVAFSIAGPQTAPILDKSVGFQSLSIESFDSITFKPVRLQVTDPGRAEDGVADIPWNSIVTDEAVVLRGRKEDLPMATLMSDDQAAGTAGRLEAISLDPGTQVILETIGGAGLTLRLDGQSLAPTVLPLGMFRLIAANTIADGKLAKAGQQNRIALRAELAPDSPLIEVRGLPRSLVLTITPVKNGAIELLSQTGAPIRDIDFTRQNKNGAREPSLVAAGEVRYPDFPTKEKVVIDPHDFFGLDQLDRFFITQLGLDLAGKQIRLRLAGVAGHIQTLAGAVREDKRLTRFDSLWYGSKPMVLFSILVWAFSVTLGAYKLYKEFKQ